MTESEIKHNTELKDHIAAALAPFLMTEIEYQVRKCQARLSMLQNILPNRYGGLRMTDSSLKIAVPFENPLHAGLTRWCARGTEPVYLWAASSAEDAWVVEHGDKLSQVSLERLAGMLFGVSAGYLSLLEDGEVKDKVLEIVEDFVPILAQQQRKSFMTELLDHLCWRCGEVLPKWGPCPSCGTSRREHGGLD